MKGELTVNLGFLLVYIFIFLISMLKTQSTTKVSQNSA